MDGRLHRAVGFKGRARHRSRRNMPPIYWSCMGTAGQRCRVRSSRYELPIGRGWWREREPRNRAPKGRGFSNASLETGHGAGSYLRPFLAFFFAGFLAFFAGSLAAFLAGFLAFLGAFFAGFLAAGFFAGAFFLATGFLGPPPPPAGAAGLGLGAGGGGAGVAGSPSAGSGVPASSSSSSSSSKSSSSDSL